MATEFICKVGPGQADYTSINAWKSAVGLDLTLSSIKVFSMTVVKGILDDGDPFEGQNSGATGTVAHANAAGTQVLVYGISGTFESGEPCFGTNSSEEVTINDAGNSPIAVAEMGTTGAAEDVYCELTGFTTSSTNKVILRPQTGHEAQMPYDTSRYRYERAASLSVATDHIDILQLQFASTNNQGCLSLSAPSGNGWVRKIDGCILKDFNGQYKSGINMSGSTYTGTGYVFNCVLYDAPNADNYAVTLSTAGTYYVYNNTVVNVDTGFRLNSFTGTEYVSNNIIDIASGGDTGFGSFSTTRCTNNYSSSTSSHNLTTTDGDYNVSFTYVAEGSDNFHLDTSDTSGAINGGTNLYSAGVTTDFDGDARPSSGDFEVGADEHVASGVTGGCAEGDGEALGANTNNIGGLGEGSGEALDGVASTASAAEIAESSGEGLDAEVPAVGGYGLSSGEALGATTNNIGGIGEGSGSGLDAANIAQHGGVGEATGAGLNAANIAQHGGVGEGTGAGLDAANIAQYGGLAEGDGAALGAANIAQYGGLAEGSGEALDGIIGSPGVQDAPAQGAGEALDAFAGVPPGTGEGSGEGLDAHVPAVGGYALASGEGFDAEVPAVSILAESAGVALDAEVPAVAFWGEGSGEAFGAANIAQYPELIESPGEALDAEVPAVGFWGEGSGEGLDAEVPAQPAVVESAAYALDAEVPALGSYAEGSGEALDATSVVSGQADVATAGGEALDANEPLARSNRIFIGIGAGV